MSQVTYPKPLARAAAGLLFLLLAACSGPGGGAGVTLDLEDDYFALYPGEVRTVSLSVEPTGGFGGSLALELRQTNGDPAPAWVLLNPSTVNVSGTTTVSLTLQVAAGAPLGKYPLDLVAGGNRTAFTLHVVPEAGSRWTPRTPPTSQSLYGVTSGPPHAFLAVGASGAAYYSDDAGATWTDHSTPSGYTLNAAAPVSATTYIAAGYNRSTWRIDVAASTTTDVTPSYGVGYFHDIALGGGRYVIVGMKGEIYTSDDDGLTWTARTSGTTKTLEVVVYDGTRFVAAGDDGVLLESADGVGWTPLPSVAAPNLQGLAYGDGVYVAAATNGEVLVSSDGGASWSSWDSGAAWLYDVAYGNGTFVVVGANGYVLTSNDQGAHWTLRVVGADSLFGVAYGNGTFVAVGKNGRVLTSP